MNPYIVNEPATESYKPEPRGWLKTFADILFACAVLVVVFALFWLPGVIIVLVLGFILISLSVSMLHAETFDKSQRIDGLEKQINELKDSLAQK